jgi:type VI secretion system protein VasJ
MEAEFQSLVERCLAPLPGEDPAGADKIFDVEYSKVKDEADKVGTVDWGLIVKGAQALLETQTKDIRVAGFLTLALFRARGYKGLEAGLAVFAGILSGFDSKYYPRLKEGKAPDKARRLAVEMLDGRITPFLAADKPRDSEAEAVVGAHDLLVRIREVCGQSLSQQPVLSHIEGALEEYRGEMEKKLAPPPLPPKAEAPAAEPAAPQAAPLEAAGAPVSGEAATSPPAAAVSPAPQAAPPAPVQTSAADAVALPALSGDSAQALKQIATALREADLSNALAYRILRLAQWEPVGQSPGGGAAETQIPAPRKEILDALRNVLSNPDPLVVVKRCEEFYSSYGVFWLDLQRHCHAALKKAGPQFAKAAEAVRQETARFIKRVPDLPCKTYKGGFAFADAETRAWLEDCAAEPKGGGGQAGTALDPELEAELAKAGELAADGNAEAGLALLRQGISTARSPKAAFIRRIAAGKINLAAGRVSEARVLLEDLYKEAGAVSLAGWEPGLFLEVAALLEKACRRDTRPVSRELQDRLYTDILRLDPGFAMPVEENREDPGKGAQKGQASGGQRGGSPAGR